MRDDRIAVLIPAYEPNKTLFSIIEEIFLLEEKKLPIELIVVNDGSRSNTALEVFKQIESIKNVHVLRHEENMGKGKALKTGYKYILDRLPNVTVIVTADADGQHLAKDIMAVAKKTAHLRQPVLGVRQFSKEVPLRSHLGNIVTKLLFQSVFRTKIKDTQTGLRGFPKEIIPDFLKIDQNGYDFEFESLIYIVKHHKVNQLSIETVYEPGNPTSHFNPLRDSAKIYFVLLRHISTILFVVLLDLILFSVSLFFTDNVMTSLFIGRSISVIIYFFLMKNLVFQAENDWAWQIVFFSIIVIANILILGSFIILMSDLFGMPRLAAMVLGNLIFFLFNFFFQKYIVFRKKGMK